MRLLGLDVTFVAEVVTSVVAKDGEAEVIVDEESAEHMGAAHAVTAPRAKVVKGNTFNMLQVSKVRS